MTSFKEPTRREFLAVGSAAALAAAATAVGAQTSATDNSAIESSPFALDDLLQAAPQRTFSGENATQVAMPLGGIGAGSVCLNGYGGLQDFSIRTRPETTALPAGFSSNSPEAAFAVLHIKGDPSVTKLIEGPFPAFKIFDQGLQGQGLRRGGFEGFPRFGKCAFKGEYPFGEAELSDSSVPLEVTLLGWNPFIPLDDKNSGIPCLILEYTLRNTSAQPVEYEFSYHLSHLAPGCKPDQSATINTVIPGKGVFLHNSKSRMPRHSEAPVSPQSAEIRTSRACGCAAPDGNSIVFRRCGERFPPGHSLPTRVPTASTPRAETARPFCLQEDWRPASHEPIPSSSRGIFQTVTSRTAARRPHTRSRERRVVAPLRAGWNRCGGRIM